MSDGSLLDSAIITINLADANEAPVAVPDDYILQEDETLTITVNDSDSDQDHSTATVAIEPDHDGLTLQPDGVFTYMPEAGFVGTGDRGPGLFLPFLWR